MKWIETRKTISGERGCGARTRAMNIWQAKGMIVLKSIITEFHNMRQN